MLIEKLSGPTDEAILILNHIPKTGGTSLINGLTGLFGSEKSYRHRERKIGTDIHSPPIESLDKETLSKLSFACGHFDYGHHNLFPGRAFYYLGAVRDPVDRLISDYYWNRQSGRSDLKKIAQALTLSEYVNYKSSLKSSNMMMSSQIITLTGQSDVGRAKDIIDREYLLACHVDQLDDAQPLIYNFFGATSEPVLHDNSSSYKKSEAREQLSESEINMIYKACAKDVELIEWIQKRFELASASLKRPADYQILPKLKLRSPKNS